MSQIEIERAVQSARHLAPASPHLLSLEHGLVAQLPRGFAHDMRTSILGNGERNFNAACEAFDRWLQFDLGWVRVANPQAAVAKGQIVAVEAHTLGLWSVNLSVIADVARTPRLYGFLYTTTSVHVEMGQERFVLQLADDGAVTYLLEAVSRPRNLLARIGFPVTRAMQKKFGRQSQARMNRAVSADRLT